MKKYLIPLAIVLITAGTNCKKDKQVIAQPMEPPANPPIERRWIVTTIAGAGTQGSADGPATAARFNFPQDVVVDEEGRFFVTDVFNSSIRKIEGSQVSTYAGGNGFGIIDGIGTAAQFKHPYNIANDANGNLYVTDSEDPRIRKIAFDGKVSVYAGSAVEGFADGDAAAAKFFPGNAIVADAAGNLYVADAAFHRIRKVSLAGQVTTIAGIGAAGFEDGPAATARFASPGAIALDAQGNLYVMDRASFRIRKISPQGIVSTLAGNGTRGESDGNANDAQFSAEMKDIVVDSNGNVYVLDDNRVRKVSPQGVVSTIAGSDPGYVDGEGASAKFLFPTGLSIDAQDNIYIADQFNHRIRKLRYE